ncbi:MAG: hypothetical protein ACHREM_08500 [Polyangiales bacterium]
MPQALLSFTLHEPMPEESALAWVLLATDFNLYTETPVKGLLLPDGCALGHVDEGMTAGLLGGAIVRAFVTTYDLPLSRLTLMLTEPGQVYSWIRWNEQPLDVRMRHELQRRSGTESEAPHAPASGTIRRGGDAEDRDDARASRSR